MGVALCLRFDDDTTAAVRRIWDELALQGVSSDMIETGYPPHLTLALTNDTAGLPEPADLLIELAGMPTQITVGEPRIFAGTEIVYLSCEAAPELLSFHSQIVSAFPTDSIHEHYSVGTWTPHVSLQLRGDVERSLALVRRLWIDRAAAPAYLDLITFPPIAVIRSVKVGAA